MITTFHASDRADWWAWLAQNHASQAEVWLIYYKAGAGQPNVTYEESVEEALCFGWVDSIIQKIDEEKYARKFTPRKAGSRWSDLNRHRVAKLVREGRMTAVGLAKVDFSMPDADTPRPSRSDLPLPEWLKEALMSHPKAWENFEKLPPSHRRNYIGWIGEAKRAETRQKRILEAVKLLEKNEKLGMK